MILKKKFNKSNRNKNQNKLRKNKIKFWLNRNKNKIKKKKNNTIKIYSMVKSNQNKILIKKIIKQKDTKTMIKKNTLKLIIIYAIMNHSNNNIGCSANKNTFRMQLNQIKQ